MDLKSRPFAVKEIITYAKCAKTGDSVNKNRQTILAVIKINYICRRNNKAMLTHILRYCTHPYWKHIKGEDRLHAFCVAWLIDALPEALWMHPVNEGKRTPYEQFKVKVLGITSGMPDIMIFEPKGTYHGLAIELKYGKNGLSANQVEILNKLASKNWYCAVVRTEEDFKKVVTDYIRCEKLTQKVFH